MLLAKHLFAATSTNIMSMLAAVRHNKTSSQSPRWYPAIHSFTSIHIEEVGVYQTFSIKLTNQWKNKIE